MKRSLSKVLLAAGILSFASAHAQPSKTTLKEASDAQLSHVTATVEAIDLKNRVVTLKGPQGNVQALHVGEGARNLPQLKVGDVVDIDYYESIAINVKKTSGKAALAETIATDRAPAGAKPGGATLRKVHVITEVMGINTEAQTVLVKGPLGNLTEVKVKDPKLLAQLQAGGQVDLTYLEGLAISVRTPAK